MSKRIVTITESELRAKIRAALLNEAEIYGTDFLGLDYPLDDEEDRARQEISKRFAEKRDEEEMSDEDIEELIQQHIDSYSDYLKESIECEESDFERAAPHKNKLIELIQDEEVDVKQVAEELARWISDDQARDFMRLYNIYDDDEDDDVVGFDN